MPDKTALKGLNCPRCGGMVPIPEGQEIVIIAASLNDERPVDPRVCRTCGREYFGLECGHCRDARMRLRGR